MAFSTTASNAGWDFLPLSDRDRVVCVTRDQEIKLLRTPVLPWQENRLEQVTDVQILADGFKDKPYQELLGAIEGMEFKAARGK